MLRLIYWEGSSGPYTIIEHLWTSDAVLALGGDKGDAVFAFELSLVERNRYTNSFKQTVVLRNKLGKTEPID